MDTVNVLFSILLASSAGTLVIALASAASVYQVDLYIWCFAYTRTNPCAQSYYKRSFTHLWLTLELYWHSMYKSTYIYIWYVWTFGSLINFPIIQFKLFPLVLIVCIISKSAINNCECPPKHNIRYQNFFVYLEHVIFLPGDMEALPTLFKMGCFSSITMCQYWDNRLLYWEYTDYFTNMSQ